MDSGVSGSGDVPEAPDWAEGGRLPPHQELLLEALDAIEPILAAMYKSSVLAMRQPDSPDRLALAAHGMRELMEKLPRHLDLPVPTDPGLANRVRQLAADWPKTTQALNGTPPNLDPLVQFAKKLDAFFDWLTSQTSTRKQQVQATIRRLDPARRALPGKIEKLRVDEWDECHGYFQGVSHHTKETSQDEFESWLDVIERFLLDRLRPRTSQDQQVIDALIAEGEANA